MPRQTTALTLQSIDRRLGTVERILPTLATKEEMAKLATKEEIAKLATKEEIAKLATKEEVAKLATKEEVAKLATKEEMRAEGRETRRHFDVIAESIRSEVRLVAEGQVRLTERFDAFEAKTERAIANLDLRVLRLEAKGR